MNSTKSLLLLAIVGYTMVSGAVIRKNLAQADCPILSGQVVASGQAVLTSTAAGAVAETTTGSQTITDLQCGNSADVVETSAEVAIQSGKGCEAAKKLYLFGGEFDYFDTVSTTEAGQAASTASSTGVSTATARSSLESGSSGALPNGVCVNACTGASFPVPTI